MIDPSNVLRARLNAELSMKETNTYLAGSQKKALKRAKAARLAFRKSKGYETDTFWSKLKKLLKKKSI